jgi:hypothetical protein
VLFRSDGGDENLLSQGKKHVQDKQGRIDGSENVRREHGNNLGSGRGHITNSKDFEHHPTGSGMSLKDFFF